MSAKVFDDYLATATEAHRPLLQALHEVISSEAPELAPKIWQYAKPMLGYGSYHYRYASGREGDWFVIGLAANKGYVSLYVCMANHAGYLAEQHRHRLGKVSIGKSCIRIKKLADLDLDGARGIVREAAEMFARGEGFSM